MIRKPVWFVLVIGGCTVVILALIVGSAPIAFALAVVTVGVWILWGLTIAHVVGIRRQVARHLGSRWMKGAVLTHKVKTGERVNVQAALNALLEKACNRQSLLGLHLSGSNHGLVAQIFSNPESQPIVWDSLPRAVGRDLSIANDALYLLHGRAGPFCAYVGIMQGRRGPKQATLLILAASVQRARAGLDEVLQLSGERSVYRGNVISVQRYDPADDDFTVEFHTVTPVDRDAIVLPESVLQVVERNVLGFLTHAETLRKAGRDTRHGVLLYGPPGTGKTLVTRYLANRCSACTVILLSGRQYAYLRTSCQLARLLAPSLIILEDVDLIAADRRKNRHAPLLHELMDEMDGLGPAADCTFLLTTNQPDSLEPALAARPGRVDQAIYFPLPDLECRRRLFEQFGKGLDLSGVNQEPLFLRTEGASPAFLKELVRRSALMAAERGERSNPLRLTDQDFERALRELIEFGGALTRNFLGFPASSRDGERT